jgi:tetratricopeptide (TPR) repeat protein
MTLRRSPVRLAALFAVACAGSLPAIRAAHAQDLAEERQCAGQRRASNEERIAACTALIDSGRYEQPNLAILHYNRGIAMRAKGDLAGALGELSEAVKLDPDYAHAFAERGSIRAVQHELDGAMTDLDTALSLDANDASSFLTRGTVFEAKGDLDHAVADYGEAIRLAPNYAAA